ncbi:MAG: hypothetical protein AB9834_13495 [Lentimicrobium sp.]
MELKWNDGMMEQWNDGKMEYWNIGMTIIMVGKDAMLASQTWDC